MHKQLYSSNSKRCFQKIQEKIKRFFIVKKFVTQNNRYLMSDLINLRDIKEKATLLLAINLQF